MPQEFLRNLIINNAGRLRSGWRFLFFAVVYLFVLQVALAIVYIVATLLFGNLPGRVERIFDGNWAFIIQGVVVLATATVLGWLFGRVLEDLPLRALGWALHRNWLRDLLIGCLVGAISVTAAMMISALFGGLRFSLNLTSDSLFAVAQTAFLSAIIFLVGAAAEEVLFRGYPLQTVMRSWPVWVAFLPVSILFASAHLGNPNVTWFAFINIALAGLWLTIAYMKTRSLWFPLGVHWAWNWVMSALLGSPVSGITQITPDPVLRASDHGPQWLTGGDFGIEGGAACTIVLLLSTLFLWRTRTIGATEEMKRFTDAENPNPPLTSITNRTFEI